MPDQPYSILPAWHDVLVYTEHDGPEGKDGRRIEFSSPSLVDPPQVRVPDAAQWRAQMPAWAYERRALILERLRKAGCSVHERDGDASIVQSPDGSFRVVSLLEPDDRGPAWETTDIVAQPGGEVLLHLTLYAATAVKFPAPASVELELQGRYGARHRLRVHTGVRTFVLDAGPEQPLDRLAALLYPPTHGAPPALPSAPAHALGQLGSVLMMLASLVFVAGGLWMALTAAQPKDRWAGLAGVVFFGLCGLVPLNDWRRQRRARRRE